MTEHRHDGLYFVNAWIDFMLIGGVSLFGYAIITALGPGPREAWATSLGGMLVWVVNWPHFSATNFRLYRSRPNVAQFPLTAIALPLVILGAVAASLVWQDAFAPYFVKLYAVWSPYHFSGQTLGLSLLYARRAGLTVDPKERLVLSTFVFGTFAWMIARLESGAQMFVYHGVRYPSLGVPEWVATLMGAAVWVAGGLIVVRVVLGALKKRRTYPPIVLLAPAAQLLWFVAARAYPNYTEFVPFFHALQYLLVAWALQLKERMDETDARPAPEFVAVESARWLAANIAGGAMLFYVFPRLAAACGYPLAMTTGIVLAAVQIHHFFVDGVIWKLRDTRLASPVHVRFSELWGESRAEAAAR
ncbi:MAG: hypothetical protein HY925_10150 [Elusimicrobia bacterium]|nr:hypothetical protein [Elusimicrobiota bacterium]